MKKTFLSLLVISFLNVLSSPNAGAVEGDSASVVTTGLSEIPHGQVELSRGFWGPRLKTQHAVTIPHALNELEKDGHVTNFEKAAGKFDGPLKGHHAFDSDLHKALEGACCSLQHFEDKTLSERVDAICRKIVAAQQKDGFLISYFIVNGMERRWDDLRLEHQMYNAGHYFEMAIAHQRATRQDFVLTSAKKFADNLDATFGEGKRYDVDGHEEVELALVRLYRATGDQKYLKLARFFVDERGYAHGTERKPFDPSTAKPPVRPEGKLTEEQQREFRRAGYRVRNGRMQDHKPLLEQDVAVGHAVRAGYIYSAMTDMARFMNSTEYGSASERLWQDVVDRKLYITGGFGTGQYHDEGFGDPYLLPNDSAYCESCAQIASVFWQHRLALLRGQAKYADVMELTLYNGMLSGISLSGDSFFYQNPLSSKNGGRRSKWIGLSCCPTNLARIIPQIGGFVYAQEKGRVYVNLYAQGEANFQLIDGPKIKLTQQTEYPWEGRIKITVTPKVPTEFDLRLRIPGWAMGHPVPSDLYSFVDFKPQPIVLKINGEKAIADPDKFGYVHLKREWRGGDVVELELPMPVQKVRAHEKVKANESKVALMRGPIVYCLEGVDHPGQDVSKIVLGDVKFNEQRNADELEAAVVLTAARGNDPASPTESPLKAIPYYAWANREKGGMTVWINAAPNEPKK